MTYIEGLCFNCQIKKGEDMCIYCTECRLKMAKGEIESPLQKGMDKSDGKTT